MSQTWIARNTPNAIFSAVAYSTNGDKIAAAANTGVYTSTNFGLDWKLTSAPGSYFFSIACSSDGNQIFANAYHGPIYASRDSGATWNVLNTPGTNWLAVACSADGNTLFAAAENNTGNAALYMSTNSGVSWAPTPGVLTGEWWSVALSADGQKMFAQLNGGGTYASTNSGVTWNATGAASAFAISSDGQKFIAGASSGVFISTNFGISGTSLPDPSAPGYTATIFGPIAMSADGLSVIGDELCGALYTSEDGGTNWILAGVGGSLNAVAESPNGAWRLAAPDTGGVWISYVPESAPLFIEQPASTNLTETTVLTLKAVAVGSGPITYQWQRDGTNLTDDARITGSTNAELTITNLVIGDSGSYILVASNYLGMTNSEIAMVTVNADDQRPVVQIYDPAPNDKMVGAGFSVYGGTRDNGYVTGIWCQLNGGEWFVPRTYDNMQTFMADISPTKGKNVFSVYAVDSVGNVSFTNSVTFNAEPQGNLHAVSLGGGKVKSAQNDKYVDLGTLCKVSAIPDKGYIFSGWSGDIQSTDPSLSFRLTNSTVNVAASFVPNPFIAAKGRYQGTIITTPPIPGRQNQLIVQVLKDGSFVAKMIIDNQKFTHSGKFAPDGTATFTVSEKQNRSFGVSLQLHLNTADGISATFSGYTLAVVGGANKVTK